MIRYRQTQNQYPGIPTDSGLKVKDIIDDNGNWDLRYLTPLVTNQTLAEILGNHIPRYTNIPDTMHWAGAPQW